jgi:hypothetical protein
LRSTAKGIVAACFVIVFSQVMYPYPWQTITEDSFPSALAALRKCDALKAKKVRINMFEMIRENPTRKK